MGTPSAVTEVSLDEFARYLDSRSGAPTER